jgi:hypothetical protein
MTTIISTSVFKPGLMVNRVLTGLLGFDQVYLNFFINQNDFVLVKNKKIVKGLQPGFDRILPSQPIGSAGFLTTLIFL